VAVAHKSWDRKVVMTVRRRWSSGTYPLQADRSSQVGTGRDDSTRS
jgi:hypothetical protein